MNYIFIKTAFLCTVISCENSLLYILFTLDLAGILMKYIRGLFRKDVCFEHILRFPNRHFFHIKNVEFLTSLVDIFYEPPVRKLGFQITIKCTSGCNLTHLEYLHRFRI